MSMSQRFTLNNFGCLVTCGRISLQTNMWLLFVLIVFFGNHLPGLIINLWLESTVLQFLDFAIFLILFKDSLLLWQFYKSILFLLNTILTLFIFNWRISLHSFGSRFVNFRNKGAKLKISLSLLLLHVLLFLHHGALHRQVIVDIGRLVVNGSQMIIRIDIGNSAVLSNIPLGKVTSKSVRHQWLRLQLNIALILGYAIVTHLKWRLCISNAIFIRHLAKIEWFDFDASDFSLWWCFLCRLWDRRLSPDRWRKFRFCDWLLVCGNFFGIGCLSTLLFDLKRLECLLWILDNESILSIVSLSCSQLVNLGLESAVVHDHLFLVFSHLDSSPRLSLSFVMQSSRKFVYLLFSDGVLEFLVDIAIFRSFFVFVYSGSLSLQVNADLLKALLFLAEDVRAFALLGSWPRFLLLGRVHPLLEVSSQLVIRDVLKLEIQFLLIVQLHLHLRQLVLMHWFRCPQFLGFRVLSRWSSLAIFALLRSATCCSITVVDHAAFTRRRWQLIGEVRQIFELLVRCVRFTNEFARQFVVHVILNCSLPEELRLCRGHVWFFINRFCRVLHGALECRLLSLSAGCIDVHICWLHSFLHKLIVIHLVVLVLRRFAHLLWLIFCKWLKMRWIRLGRVGGRPGISSFNIGR